MNSPPRRIRAGNCRSSVEPGFEADPFKRDQRSDFADPALSPQKTGLIVAKDPRLPSKLGLSGITIYFPCFAHGGVEQGHMHPAIPTANNRRISAQEDR